GRLAHLTDDQVLDLVGIQQDHVGRRGVVGFGKTDHDAVVAPYGLYLAAGTAPHRSFDGEGPGRVDPGAEGRQHRDAPVTELVPEPLDDQLAVRGHQPTGR